MLTPTRDDKPGGSTVQIAVAVVEHEDRFLIGQRPPGQHLAGYWEFPGGKIRSGETPADAACRECLEETGIAVYVAGLVREVTHNYEGKVFRLHFFHVLPKDPGTVPSDPFRWIARGSLPKYQFPDANREVIAFLSSRPLTRDNRHAANARAIESGRR